MKDLRHKLHQFPELAFRENETCKIIKDYIQNFGPDEVFDPVARTGLAFVFKGQKSKPRIAFRADLDGLEVTEQTRKSYSSKHMNHSHACGHDGHMTMVSALAKSLKEIKNRGDVVLLFQPAEETGEGAKKLMEDEKFKSLNVDYIFGLHNLPEYPLGSVVVRKGTFACASVGLKVFINGHSSHAGQPELSLNPFDKITEFKKIIEEHKIDQKDVFYLATLTHLRLGAPSFGITPGELVCFITLRSNSESFMLSRLKLFKDQLQDLYPGPFQVRIEETDFFPEIMNNDQCVDFISSSARDLDFPLVELKEPMRWSEDFGHYTKKIKGAFFGLGLGMKTPLHHPEYDFNDEALSFGVELYQGIIKKVNENFIKV